MESEFVKRLMEHRSMLHSFVYALLRDPHLTEDILQEVAVVLWSKYSEFRPGTDFGAWARSVAYREVLSARRSEARARRYMDDACVQQILAAYQRPRGGGRHRDPSAGAPPLHGTAQFGPARHHALPLRDVDEQPRRSRRNSPGRPRPSTPSSTGSRSSSPTASRRGSWRMPREARELDRLIHRYFEAISRPRRRGCSGA
jgi:RNA polymerase sigma factor (sigma-70 family)